MLLLADPKSDTLRLPEGDCIGHSDEPNSLLGVLRGLGIAAELGFVFAVFEGRQPAAGMSVYYRGTLAAAPPANPALRLTAYGDISWPQLPSDDIRTMLRRYVDESLQGRYGLYLGDRHGGQVHPL